MSTIKISVQALLLMLAVSTSSFVKESENIMKGKESGAAYEEISNYHGYNTMPAFPVYRFQYNPSSIMTDFPDFHDDQHTEHPEVRSFQGHKREKASSRRHVLLWPRPIGWEWDGSVYRWGPGNIFFGGPGFPW